MSPKKCKRTLDAVHQVQRSTLDAALKLIKDAKESKKPTWKLRKNLDESSPIKYSVAMKSNCHKPKFSDMRLLNDSERLVREMRAAFCRWDWDGVVDLLVFAAQTEDKSLLDYAQACFPVLVMQHPSLSTQGRNLIEEAMFAAGIADPTDLTDKLFTLHEDDVDRESIEEKISKLFSPRSVKRRSVKKRLTKPEDSTTDEDDNTVEGKEENWVKNEKEEEEEEENEKKEKEEKNEEDEESEEDERMEEEDNLLEEGEEEIYSENGACGVSFNSGRIESVRLLNQEDYMLGDDNSDDFVEDFV